MRVEVDSSGIWGNRAEPTVFAFSNSLSQAIRIAPEVNRIPIRVRRIGKTSRAHDLANAVYRGERSPDRQIQADEILELF